MCIKGKKKKGIKSVWVTLTISPNVERGEQKHPGSCRTWERCRDFPCSGCAVRERGAGWELEMFMKPWRAVIGMIRKTIQVHFTSLDYLFNRLLHLSFLRTRVLPYPSPQYSLIPDPSAPLSLTTVLPYLWAQCSLIPDPSVPLSLNPVLPYPWSQCSLMPDPRC